MFHARYSASHFFFLPFCINSVDNEDHTRFCFHNCTKYTIYFILLYRLIIISYIRVSTAKSLNLSNTLLDIRGNEHTGSDGTNISCVGKIGALTGGSGFTFSFSDGLPLSNIKLIAISTLPSANDKYCCAVASFSPNGNITFGDTSPQLHLFRARYTQYVQYCKKI